MLFSFGIKLDLPKIIVAQLLEEPAIVYELGDRVSVTDCDDPQTCTHQHLAGQGEGRQPPGLHIHHSILLNDIIFKKERREK